MVPGLLLAMALNAGPVSAAAPAVPTAGLMHTEQAQGTDVQAIAGLIARQFDAWNARDLDGYMATFWRSPQLIYVSDGTIWTGWEQVRSNVERDYPNKDAMGRPVLERLQINVIAPDTATTLEWWTVYFAAAKVHGISSSAWRRFPEGWRIVEVHSSSVELP